MKAIVSLSGGMDSSTVLADAIAQGREVSCIGFRYGSKHNPFENKAAEAVARFYGVPFRLIDLSAVMVGFKSNLMADGGDVPEGHYEDKSMALTVVPARNLIFASVLTGVAWTEEAEEVWLGIHLGDRAIYPDCRKEFFDAMNQAVQVGTDNRVRLQAPFLTTNKIGILMRGLELDVPYQFTRTCYKAQPVACGKCGSCQERLAAFHEVGADDPIEYEHRELLPA